MNDVAKQSPAVTRGQRRRERTRIAILDAAERAFTELGYRGARMEDIAEAADVAVGSLYGHFGSKDGLYLALAERSVELFGGYMAQCYRDDLSPLEQVLAGGDAYLRFHLEHPGAFRFLALEGVETVPGVVPEADRARLADRTEQLLDEFEAAVAAAMDQGEATRRDTRLICRFLWGAWNGVVALGLRTDKLRLSDAEIAATLQMGRRIVLDGLAAHGFRDADGSARARLVSIAAPPGTTPD